MSSHQGSRQEVREVEGEAMEEMAVVVLELALELEELEELAWGNLNICQRKSPRTP